MCEFPLKVELHEYAPGVRRGALYHGYDGTPVHITAQDAERIMGRVNPENILVKYRCKTTIDDLVWTVHRFSDPVRMAIGYVNAPLTGMLIPDWVIEEIYSIGTYTEMITYLSRKDLRL
jgi:hypothetical protein